MILNTKHHGIIEYNEDDIIIFKKGIPGFGELKRFVLVDVKENDIFKLLHSLEDNSIGFVVVSPFDVISEYEMKLKEELVESLNIEQPEEVLLVNTVTLNSDITKATTNLRAPIVINIKKRFGEQIIIENEQYKVKHPLIKR